MKKLEIYNDYGGATFFLDGQLVALYEIEGDSVTIHEIEQDEWVKYMKRLKEPTS